MQEYYKVKALDSFNDKITKQNAEIELKDKPLGAYLIRESSLNLKKQGDDKGYYFAISFVDKAQKVNHRLIYVPHDEQALTHSALFRPVPIVDSCAVVVVNINEYLKENSHQFKTPLVTDP
ncbi:SH2 domain-containing protein [Legionella hackeliae]|uniref:SH2 domain-containing protein n=1 Tax=Legionella hackeliae TaxID=449 RepID=A0A0A8UXX9_LEGHA|nr:SH2 domain-containing protein [Legionella hackeliae]KTD13102.1 hypothetical protein Lhac_0971 [Legionella hackeliae]CEK11589.1 protein of unknown function [SH2 motif] [Legionella hackeliae]STX48361.1 Uncharacterised protein [Legionella hackeliae]